MRELGIFLSYPVRPPLAVPTWIGACSGTDSDLPIAQTAFKDPRSVLATELMVRLLRQKSAFETPFAGETNFLLSAEIFPYFYSLKGDRSRKHEPEEIPRKEFSSPLAYDAYALIQRNGPISKRRLIEKLRGALSEAAIEHVLNDLWAKLRITRVDYKAGEGALWDVLHRWAPDAVEQGGEYSLAEALSAMLSKYIQALVAADPAEIENFFAHFTSRSKVREAVNALLGARQFMYVPVGRRTLIELPETQRKLNAGQRRPTPASLRAELKSKRK